MPKTLERPTDTTDAPTAPPATASEAKVRPLTGHDRCDARAVNHHKGVKGKGSCGAQAFILAVFPNGQELTFCGHHVGKQKTSNIANVIRLDELKAAGAQIRDEYDTINGKPTM